VSACQRLKNIIEKQHLESWIKKILNGKTSRAVDKLYMHGGVFVKKRGRSECRACAREVQILIEMLRQKITTKTRLPLLR